MYLAPDCGGVSGGETFNNVSRLYFDLLARVEVSLISLNPVGSARDHREFGQVLATEFDTEFNTAFVVTVNRNAATATRAIVAPAAVPW